MSRKVSQCVISGTNVDSGFCFGAYGWARCCLAVREFDRAKTKPFSLLSSVYWLGREITEKTERARAQNDSIREHQSPSQNRTSKAMFTHKHAKYESERVSLHVIASSWRVAIFLRSPKFSCQRSGRKRKGLKTLGGVIRIVAVFTLFLCPDL